METTQECTSVLDDNKLQTLIDFLSLSSSSDDDEDELLQLQHERRIVPKIINFVEVIKS